MKNWNAFSLGNNATVEDYLTIIDDSLCHGFEFKVENGCVYWREKD